MCFESWNLRNFETLKTKNEETKKPRNYDTNNSYSSTCFLFLRMVPFLRAARMHVLSSCGVLGRIRCAFLVDTVRHQTAHVLVASNPESSFRITDNKIKPDSSVSRFIMQSFSTNVNRNLRLCQDYTHHWSDK